MLSGFERNSNTKYATFYFYLEGEDYWLNMSNNEMDVK